MLNEKNAGSKPKNRRRETEKMQAETEKTQVETEKTQVRSRLTIDTFNGGHTRSGNPLRCYVITVPAERTSYVQMGALQYIIEEGYQGSGALPGWAREAYRDVYTGNRIDVTKSFYNKLWKLMKKTTASHARAVVMRNGFVLDVDPEMPPHEIDPAYA